MALQNPPFPISPERQDQLRRLSDSLGGAMERLHLLDLQPASQHFAGDWPRLAAKVHSIVEGTLRKCLPETDTFAALDDMSYAIICAPAKISEIRETMERISDEITRRIMGDNSRKVFVTITSAEPEPQAEQKHNVDKKVSNIERIIGDIVADEDEFTFDAINHVMRAMVGWDRRPINILAPTAMCTSESGRVRFGYDCLPPESDTSLVAELDALTAESAARQLSEMDRRGHVAMVQVPVHRATLSSRKYRELYLKICRGLFSRYKSKLIFDIFGIEDGTPSNRVTEHMQWLRPYGRAVSATVDIDFSTLNSFTGASIFSLGVSLDAVEDEVVELKLSRFITRLKGLDCKCHVHGLRTQTQVGMCCSQMVCAMNGPILGEPDGRRLQLVRNNH